MNGALNGWLYTIDQYRQKKPHNKTRDAMYKVVLLAVFLEFYIRKIAVVLRDSLMASTGFRPLLRSITETYV